MAFHRVAAVGNILIQGPAVVSLDGIAHQSLEHLAAFAIACRRAQGMKMRQFLRPHRFSQNPGQIALQAFRPFLEI